MALAAPPPKPQPANVGSAYMQPNGTLEMSLRTETQDGTIGETARRQRLQIAHTRTNQEWVSEGLGAAVAQFFPVLGMPSSTWGIGAVLILLLGGLAAALPCAQASRLKIVDALRKT